MVKIVTEKVKNAYLKTRNRFYICGWFDASNDTPAQASTIEKDEAQYADYLEGYKDSILFDQENT